MTAQNIAKNTVIFVKISCIFLYLAYMRCKVLGGACGCADAAPYRSHPGRHLEGDARHLEDDGLSARHDGVRYPKYC